MGHCIHRLQEKSKESLSVWVGTEKRGKPRKGLSVPFAYHLALQPKL